uniref:Galectin domain-containing protein n=1 Tax=Oryza rufipogon TaxID=4529 RepID=A0A0E0QRS4_ORYRU
MAMKAPASSNSYLLLAPLALLLLAAVVFLLPSLNGARVGSDGGLGVLCARRSAGAEDYTVAAPAAPKEEEKPELSLLVGVLTMPKRYERRDIVRLAYALQPAAARARVDVRFVFCRVADPVDAQLVALEAARHGDVVVLGGCEENMNHGKTHAYLSSVPRLFASSPYDYVMKTDDDTYLRVAALVDELRGKPRDDVYLGYGYAMGGQPMPFMHGMGYVVSWDVATWVSTAEEILARNDTEGPEDLMVGKWLNLAGRGRNRYDLKPRMYDLSWDMDNFRPDTVAVHMLKDNRRWAAAFSYFNTASSSSSSSHGFPATASLCTPYLLLVPLGLLAVVLVVPSLGSSHVRSDGLGVLCHAGPSAADGYLVTPGGDAASAAAAAAETKAVVRPELRLLVGVLTTPKRYERRNIVRLAYALQPAVPPGVAQVDVRFVFCRVADPVDAQLVALEAARHGDILVLNCTENMNDGKTHEYLSSVPRMFASSPYDYVMKTDDDTYLRVAALVDELRHKPRDDVYLGYGFAVGDDPMQFMHGMGYVVSWDVATWVSTNEDILRYNDTHGPEDLLVGKWLNIGRRGKNRYSLRPRMYDLNWDMDNFRPDTVLVHMLKDNRRWAAAFRYFNVTAGLQPSNLYHFP